MTTYNIPIILGSTRNGRNSSRVSAWLEGRLGLNERVETKVVDLRELALPMMEERLRFLKNPPASVVSWGETIGRADALIIVTPEYNGGYPGVLKNAIDYLQAEYKRKPVGIVTVSAGVFGGVRMLEQLRHVMTTAGAVPIPASLPVPKVAELFAEDGTLNDASFESRADRFLAELLWYTEALGEMRKRESEATA